MLMRLPRLLRVANRYTVLGILVWSFSAFCRDPFDDGGALTKGDRRDDLRQVSHRDFDLDAVENAARHLYVHARFRERHLFLINQTPHLKQLLPYVRCTLDRMSCRRLCHAILLCTCLITVARCSASRSSSAISLARVRLAAPTSCALRDSVIPPPPLAEIGRRRWPPARRRYRALSPRRAVPPRSPGARCARSPPARPGARG